MRIENGYYNKVCYAVKIKNAVGNFSDTMNKSPRVYK